jgi:hypothetical protein
MSEATPAADSATNLVVQSLTLYIGGAWRPANRGTIEARYMAATI